MAFPTTSVLDTFTRADAPTLGANWSAPIDADLGASPSIVSNQAAFPGGDDGAYWNPSTFGPDSEVYLDVATTGGVSDIKLYLRLSSPGATVNGYQFDFNTFFQRLRYYRLDSGVLTQLGANETGWPGPVSGDQIGGEASGTTLIAYHGSGGVWTAFTSRTDSTYSAAGNIGFLSTGTADRVDNFGGGTTVVTANNQLAWIKA